MFNEEATIPIFYDRFCRAVELLRARDDVELIFSNNRSVDKSLHVIMQIRTRDSNVPVITLSHNFGYQASLQMAIAVTGTPSYPKLRLSNDSLR